MIKTIPENDSKLSQFAQETLKNRYLLPHEKPQDMFVRVAETFADGDDHAQRLYEYMSNLWFMPATPILSNAGTRRGLPISCFLQTVQDDLIDIADNYAESVLLSSNGGGLGIYYGDLRSRGERIKVNGQTSGVTPFMKVNDSLTLAISQGNLRRGAAAVYLPVWHPEIQEFLEIRKPSGGDYNRKSLNVHHGVCIDDRFMQAVGSGSEYDLISPHTGQIMESVDARAIWQKILTVRLETGEPYIVFVDRLKESTPPWHAVNGLYPHQSNLCSEITLPTNQERTAVCCLSSLNLETWDEWKDNQEFILDIYRFLDNVLQMFIKQAPTKLYKAVKSAYLERSVGLGVMGFQSLMQKKNLPLDSAMARALNRNIFSHVRQEADEASEILAQARGPCPDAGNQGYNQRFSYKLAIAPTANISIIAGTSPSIEPWASNHYKHKTQNGTFIVKNKYLSELLDEKGFNVPETWAAINRAEGSVQDLSFLSQEEKDVFKTAFEINQRLLVTLAADRQEFIDQAQSLNVFIPSGVDKKELHAVHFDAWKKGLKTMYYCRSKAIAREEKVGPVVVESDECFGCA